MRLQDLNWMDVERYLTRDNRIILITGSTEQHAYLSLMTDILIPSRIAEAVAQREGVLIAPPLNFGVSYYFGEFPGTISLSQQTFDYALLEIVESLFHQGFRRFFVFNGHGGNQIPERLQDFQMDGIIQVVWYNWWRSNAATRFASGIGHNIDHANWAENFPFNRVSESPKNAKPPVNSEFLDTARYESRQMLGDGSFGGEYEMPDEVMLALFDAVVDEAAQLVQSMGIGDG